jgi:hypothetical protein
MRRSTGTSQTERRATLAGTSLGRRVSGGARPFSKLSSNSSENRVSPSNSSRSSEGESNRTEKSTSETVQNPTPQASQTATVSTDIAKSLPVEGENTKEQPVEEMQANRSDWRQRLGRFYVNIIIFFFFLIYFFF